MSEFASTGSRLRWARPGVLIPAITRVYGGRRQTSCLPVTVSP